MFQSDAGAEVLPTSQLFLRGGRRIPDLPEQASETAEEKVPAWVKNNAGWWANDLISEYDFLNGIKYLIKEGIIHV